MRFRLCTLLLLSLLLAGCLSLAEDVTPPPGYVAPTAAPTTAVIFSDSTTDVPTPQPVSPTPGADPAEDPSPTAEATPLQQRGSIGGVIAHGAGGEVPSGLTVTLHTFVHDFAAQQFVEGQARQTKTSTGGKYHFGDLPLSPSDAYYVSVEYNGVTYESGEIIPANEGLQDYERPITVYESTVDASNLVISTAHILLEYSQPGALQIVEFFVLENMGDETIIAAEAGRPVIEIPLPAGYQNLQLENGVLGGRFLQTADGFGDTLPILPSNGQNQYSLVFAFDLPYEADPSPLAGLFGSKKFELAQPFNLKTSLLNLLVPQGTLVEGANLVDGGLQSMGGGFTFQLYRAGSLQAGQTFSVQISGAPTAASGDLAQSGGLSRNLIIGIGAFGVALILVGIFLYWRDRQLRAEESDFDDDEEEDEGLLSQDEILDAIIALDDQFRAGNLPEAAYQERRAELKAMLRGL